MNLSENSISLRFRKVQATAASCCYCTNRFCDYEIYLTPGGPEVSDNS